MSGKPRDPIHQDPDGKWYFYDETWAYRYGPFESEEKARAELGLYAEFL